LYELARTIAVLTGDKLGIDVCKNGELVKKPHLAFDYDLIALYLATFETADITTVGKKGRAWIDASQGFGELETKDIDYAYKYLTMPENTFKIYEHTSIIKRMISGYGRYHDPVLTDNN
jgi:hypothetical protein